MNRERDRDRDIRRDRDRSDNKFSNRYQNKPPRFMQKEAAKQQFVAGGSSSGAFEKNWSNHNSFGRRGGGGPEPLDKDDDFRKDRHDRPSPSDSAPDRY